MTAPKNHIVENKPQMSLIPDDLLRDFLEPAYREGLLKYYRESWREGFPLSIMMDATKRHLTAFFHDGEELDKETLEKYGIRKYHLGAALFCILCMCDTVMNHPEMDDRRKIVKAREEIDKKQWETAVEKINVAMGFQPQVIEPATEDVKLGNHNIDEINAIFSLRPMSPDGEIMRYVDILKSHPDGTITIRAKALDRILSDMENYFDDLKENG